jgi:hypothetical protein
MTNFDPGGFLVLLTVIPAVVAGVTAITLAHLAARVGYGDYERNVVLVLAVLAAAWMVASLVVSASMLLILAVGLAVLGAYAVTRDVRQTSYGWVLGVVFLYVAFGVLAWTGVYAGVDATGRPQGVIASNLFVSYSLGLFLCGAVGGAVVRLLGRR